MEEMLLSTQTSAVTQTDSDLSPSEWKLKVPKFRCLQSVAKGNRAYWPAVLNRGFQDGFMVIGDVNNPTIKKALFKIKWVHSDVSHLTPKQIMNRAQSHDEGQSVQAGRDWKYYQTHLSSAVVELSFHYGLVFHPDNGRWYRSELDENPLPLDDRMSKPQRGAYGYPKGMYGNWPVTFLHSLERTGCQYYEIAQLIQRANLDLPESKQISEEFELCCERSRLIKYKRNVLPWAIY